MDNKRRTWVDVALEEEAKKGEERLKKRYETFMSSLERDYRKDVGMRDDEPITEDNLIPLILSLECVRYNYDSDRAKEWILNRNRNEVNG